MGVSLGFVRRCSNRDPVRTQRHFWQDEPCDRERQGGNWFKRSLDRHCLACPHVRLEFFFRYLIDGLKEAVALLPWVQSVDPQQTAEIHR